MPPSEVKNIKQEDLEFKTRLGYTLGGGDRRITV
jgi:hypothetical protein